MLYLQIASPKSSVLNFLDSNSFEVIISIFQRTEKVPDMERLPLYFQGYDEYDVWDDLCLCKEEFDIGNYQVCHYVFPECPSMEQIETAFSTTENVVSALELIFGNDFSAWCCWMGVVLNQISHIYNAYLFAKNECVKHYKNEKSLMQLYYSDKLDLMNECKLFEYDFYEVNFGNDWTMVLIKEPCYVIDKKVSYSDSRLDRKSTRLNSSHNVISRMPSSA